MPADRLQFDAAEAQALADALVGLDLTGLFRSSEQWRRTALPQGDLREFRLVVDVPQVLWLG